MRSKKLLISITSLFILQIFYFNLFPQVTPNPTIAVSVQITDSLIQTLLLSGQFEQALSIANIFIFHHSNDPISKARMLLRKCEIYLELGDKTNSILLLKQVDSIKKYLPKQSIGLEFLYNMNMGIIIFNTRERNTAILWFQKAEAMLAKREITNELDIARFLISFGNYYFGAYDSVNTIKYYKRAINILKGNTLQEKTLKLTLLSNIQIAAYYFNQGNLLSQAKSDCEVIVESITNLEHPALLNYYLNFASFYLNTDNNCLQSKQAIEKASIILEKYYPKEFKKFGLLFYFQGQYAYLEYDFEKALGYFRQAELYLEKNPDLITLMHQIYFLIGNIHFFYKKEYIESLNYYNKVISLNTNMLRNDVANSCFLSGFAHIALGDLKMALISTQKGFELINKRDFKQIGNALAYAYRCLSGIYEIMGKEDTAYIFLRKAFETTQKYSVERNIKAIIIRDIAYHYKKKGNIIQALQKYQQSLILCNKDFKDTSIFKNPSSADVSLERTMIETLNMKAFSLFQLYGYSRHNNRYLNSALECQEISILNLEKRICNMDYENSEFNWKDLINITYNNAVSYASELYDITGDKDYAEKVLRYAEKSKMFMLLLHTQEKQTKKYSNIPDSLVEKETLLHNEILNIQNRIYQGQFELISTQEKQLLITKLANVQLESDGLSSLFEKNYKSYFDLKYNINVPDINQIQTHLKKNQVLLEYQLLTSELIIIVIGKEKFSIRRIPHRGNELKVIRPFYKIISENPIQQNSKFAIREFIQASYFLFKWLVEPVLFEIKNSSLIIVPHNDLNLIPFELLIKNNPKNVVDFRSLEYLIRDFPISYAYSGALLFNKGKDQKHCKEAALFLPGNYENSSQLDPKLRLVQLQGAKDEVEVSGKLLSGDLYTDGQATESVFKLLSPNYRIIHIASHAILNDHVPTLSYLIFNPNSDTNSSDDGLLHSFELYQLQLNAELVVLSGCNTGTGKLQLGEGLLSLARSFYYTGVRSVVYTLWTIADKASAKLMKAFYKQLITGKSLEKGLQSAKLEYLQNADPTKIHPYYWAGFVISGNTSPLFPKKWKYALPFILFFFPSLGIGLLAYNTFTFRDS